jgi:hypothetical protein
MRFDLGNQVLNIVPDNVGSYRWWLTRDGIRSKTGEASSLVEALDKAARRLQNIISDYTSDAANLEKYRESRK